MSSVERDFVIRSVWWSLTSFFGEGSLLSAQGSYISAAELFHELFFVVVVDRTWNIGTVFPSPDQKKGHYSVIS